MLLLVRCKQHRVLLLRAEVEDELHFRLLQFSTLDLYNLVLVCYFLVQYHRLLFAQGLVILLVLYFNDLKLDGLSFFIILFVFGICVQTGRRTFSPYPY